MQKKMVFQDRPPVIQLRHPRILEYERRGDFWVTDLHKRPNWPSLNEDKIKTYLLAAYDILLDIGDSGSKYGCFSMDSLVVVDGTVYLDGIARGLSKTQPQQTDWDDFIASVNTNPGHQDFASINECLMWLGRNPSNGAKKRPARKRMLLVAVAFGLFFTAAGFYNYNSLSDGYQILSKVGPKAAFEYFSNKSESHQNTYGKAWTLFQLGEYSESEQLVNIVLKSPKLKHQADGFYLLGNIALRRGEYTKAIETLDSAAIYYSRIDQDRGLYLATLALANCYLLKDDAENGEFYLNKALQIDPAQNSSFLLVLKSKLEFLKGNYRTALDLNLQRLSAVENDRLSGGIYSEIGFYFALLGEMEKAFSYSLMAQQIAQKSEDVVLIHYNYVNWLLIYKCSGQDSSSLRSSLLDWAENKNDSRLMKQIAFVDDFQCAFKRSDPIFPPPPPPDPPEQDPPPEQLDN